MNYPITAFILGCFFIIASAFVPVLAQQHTQSNTNANPSTAEARETVGVITPTSEPTKEDVMINKFVELGGAIELEYIWMRDFDNVYSSDITLEAAELDFEIFVTNWATGRLVVEWDPDLDEVTVKEAFVLFRDENVTPFFLQTGRIFVPFGISTGAVVGDTLTITDPLTIEAFETRADVVLIGYAKELDNGLNAAIYFFNGDTSKGGTNDHIEHYGATLRYGSEVSGISYSVGVDYLSSVFESEELKIVFPGALTAGYTPGIAAHFKVFLNGFSIVGEYNGAIGRTRFMTIDGDILNLEPKAWQVQLAYETTLFARDTYFSLDYSESYELQGAFAKRRYLANIGMWIHHGILLGIEYGHEEDYGIGDGGTGATSDFIIGQLAYEW